MEDVLLIFSVASALCAVSTVPQRNYHFIYEAKNWTEAQSYCRENFIDLATLADMKDVATLKKLANLSQMLASSNTYDAWIGLYNDLKSWRWSMSDPSFYQQNGNFRNWYPTEPDNSGGYEACGALLGLYGTTWNDVPCSWNNLPVCMNVTGTTASLYLINTSMTFFQALNYCRSHHTDLVSVRSLSENQKVKQLVQNSFAWIGLYRNNWRWSDDSSFTFTNWNTNQPGGGTRGCVAANFKSSGGWEDWTCDLKKVFICYSGAAQEVVKLKLVDDSSMNLSDPAVLADLLNQLKLKLKDQGVNILLRWREQPDGHVFYEDENDASEEEDPET